MLLIGFVASCGLWFIGVVAKCCLLGLSPHAVCGSLGLSHNVAYWGMPPIMQGLSLIGYMSQYRAF